MPNHCENDLIITGDKKELLRFKAFAEAIEPVSGNKEILSADKFIPYPNEYKNIDKLCKIEADKRNKIIEDERNKGKSEEEARAEAFKKYPERKDGFNSGGYKWCCDNWGTKWGFYDIELQVENYSKYGKYGNELVYKFLTAWSPALPLIEAMGKMFPGLEFELRYFESGMGFNGLYTMEKGQLVKNESGNYYGSRGG